jgi:hypothetical protein
LIGGNRDWRQRETGAKARVFTGRQRHIGSVVKRMRVKRIRFYNGYYSSNALAHCSARLRHDDVKTVFEFVLEKINTHKSVLTALLAVMALSGFSIGKPHIAPVTWEPAAEIVVKSGDFEVIVVDGGIKTLKSARRDEDVRNR